MNGHKKSINNVHNRHKTPEIQSQDCRQESIDKALKWCYNIKAVRQEDKR